MDKERQTVRQMELFVDGCEFKTPKEVARFFELYTQLVWDYGQVGRIYERYPDTIAYHTEENDFVRTTDEIVAETLEYLAAVPDTKSPFMDIFAEGSPETGWRFMQAIYNEGSISGYSSLGTPSGYEMDGCIDICECTVEKVDGRWKITEEWSVRSMEGGI